MIARVLLLLGLISIPSAAFAEHIYNVDMRQAELARRIQMSFNSGRISPREADRLQADLARTEAKEFHYRQDGRLTEWESIKLAKDLEKLSAKIHVAERSRRIGWKWGNWW